MASTLPSTTDHRVALQLTPHTTLHIRIQNLSKSLVIFLTSTTYESSSGLTSLGSFVYALPDRFNPNQPMSTPLVTAAESVEFATRVAKILARRFNKPVYVGNSINLSWGPAGAGEPEVGEVVEAMRKVVEVVSNDLAKDGVNGA